MNIIKILKKILLVTLIIILIYSFSASYSSLNIDNLSFAVAIAIYKSETSKLKVSFEFVIPKSNGESGSETKPSIISVDCTSITNGINLLNAHLGRKVNLSHCKLIVFSEEFAKERCI